MTASLPTVRIGLLGCGTVGSHVVKFFRERADDFAARAGAHLAITGIAVRDTARQREDWVPADLLTTDTDAVINNADIVVELIGGIEPPYSLIKQAIAAGASVVTGNKALIAERGPELFDAAAEADVDLYYEAAVAGAVPIVYALRESLAGDTVTSVLGIVNGTTNYVLGEMAERGLRFDDAVADAQRLGYAEADPTADVDGHDAAAKGALLASLAFHTRVSYHDVDTAGIRDVTAEEMAEAAESDMTLKLLATATRRDDAAARGVHVTVAPTLIPNTHPLANVGGAYNAVVVESEAAGRLMFYGQGAGGAPTASAVISDLVAAARHRAHGGHAPRESRYAELPILSPYQAPARVHIRLELDDKPGMLASVAQVFGDQGVSIHSLRQIESGQEGQRPQVTIITHTTTEQAVTTALESLKNLPGLHAIIAVRRVEGL